MTASSLVLFYLSIFYFRTNFPNSVKTVKCAVNQGISLSVSRLFFLHAFRIASRNGLFRIQKKSSISKTRTIPLCVSLPISPQRWLNRCWGCFKKRITCQSNERNKFHWKKGIILLQCIMVRITWLSTIAPEIKIQNKIYNTLEWICDDKHVWCCVTLRRHAKSIIGNAFLFSSNWFGNSARITRYTRIVP